MKNLFLLIIYFLVSISIKAQFISNDSESAKKALGRKLYVVLDEPSKTEIKRNTKRGTLNDLQAYYDAKNEQLKEAIAFNWIINKEITYIKETEFKVLKKSKTEEFTYLTFKYAMDSKSKKHPVTGMVKNYYYYYYIFSVGISEGKELATVTSRGAAINELEYLFAVTSLQTFIKMASEGGKNRKLEEDINKGASTITNKTLLLPEYLTQLSIEEINSNYKYPVKVVSEDEVIEAIKNKTPGYAYAYVNHRMLSCGTRFNHFIMDCESGKPLLLDKRNGVALGTGDQINIFDDIQTAKGLMGKGQNLPSMFKQKFIKAKQLKKYREIIEGKDDNKEEEEDGGDKEDK